MRFTNLLYLRTKMSVSVYTIIWYYSHSTKRIKFQQRIAHPRCFLYACQTFYTPEWHENLEKRCSFGHMLLKFTDQWWVSDFVWNILAMLDVCILEIIKACKSFIVYRCRTCFLHHFFRIRMNKYTWQIPLSYLSHKNDVYGIWQGVIDTAENAEMMCGFW